MMEIKNHRLSVDGKPCAFIPSPNVGGRMQARAIVIHDTAGPSAISAINTFKSKASKVSAHFVVDLDGAITQMVECDDVAWHAGKSVLDGKSGCNAFTIGIEIVNPGKLNAKGCAWFHKPGQPGYTAIQSCVTPEHGNGYWLPYTAAQIDAVTNLCKALVKTYPAIKQIVPHWHISPKRKIDTNPLFPVSVLRDAVFSARIEPVAGVSDLKEGSEGPEVKRAQERLAALGYPVGQPDEFFGSRTEIAVWGFERQNGLAADGKLSPSDLAHLYSDKAKPMPASTRQTATVSDIQSKSRSVANLVTLKNGGLVTATLSGAAGLVESVNDSDAPPSPDVVEQLSKSAEGLGYGKQIATDVGGLWAALAPHGWIIGVIAGIALAVMASRILGFKLDDFKMGRWTPSGKQ